MRASAALAAAACAAAACASVAASHVGTASLARLPRESPGGPASFRDVRLRLAGPAALGFSRLAADVGWMDSVLYFGGGEPRAEGWRRYGPMVREVFRLSRRWVRAYEYAVIALGFLLNRSAEAASLARAASEANPGHPRFSLYVAGIAATRAKDDVTLLRMLEDLARDPGHPLLLDRTLGLVYERRGMRAEAIGAWRRVLASSTDAGSIRAARRRLTALGAEPGDPRGR